MRYSPSPEQQFFRERTQLGEAPLSRIEENLMDTIGGQYLKSRPKQKDFKDLFGLETVQEDLAKVHKKVWKPGYRGEHDRSYLLEAILWQDIELQNWLGENVSTITASEFDNKIRGFDLVLEAVQEKPSGEESVFRLGVDVVLTDRPELVLKKWKEIVFGIKGIGKYPHLMRVRYFSSVADPKFRGEILVPRVILGMDPRHYQDLIQAISANDQKLLADHPVKDLLAAELALQLNQLQRLPSSILKLIEGDILGMSRVIQNLQKKPIELSNWTKEDAVYSGLKKYVSNQQLFQGILRGEITPLADRESLAEKTKSNRLRD